MLITRRFLATAATALAALATAGTATAADYPYQDPNLPIPQRVADLMGRMDLSEKIGQMTQTERYQVYDDETPITTYKLGSILSGGGSTPTENTPSA
jgi:beta-glucosidase